MIKKKSVRFCSLFLAVTICIGVVGGAVAFNQNIPNDSDLLYEDAVKPVIKKDIDKLDFSRANNLKFKISELWRLSLNSDLDFDIRNSLNVLNERFDSEILSEMVQQTGEEFDLIADEYLAALQMGLDFKLYINERTEYENEKVESKYNGTILTISLIDKYLNELSKKVSESIINKINDSSVDMLGIVQPNANPNIPKAEDIMPKNPADEIQAEINDITKR